MLSRSDFYSKFVEDSQFKRGIGEGVKITPYLEGIDLYAIKIANTVFLTNEMKGKPLNCPLAKMAAEKLHEYMEEGQVYTFKLFDIDRQCDPKVTVDLLTNFKLSQKPGSLRLAILEDKLPEKAIRILTRAKSSIFTTMNYGYCFSYGELQKHLLENELSALPFYLIGFSTMKRLILLFLITLSPLATPEGNQEDFEWTPSQDLLVYTSPAVPAVEGYMLFARLYYEDDLVRIDLVVIPPPLGDQDNFDCEAAKEGLRQRNIQVNGRYVDLLYECFENKAVVVKPKYRSGRMYIVDEFLTKDMVNFNRLQISTNGFLESYSKLNRLRETLLSGRISD